MRSSTTPQRLRRLCVPLRLERLETRVVPSFLAARAFDAGESPQSVAMADFNGDNRLDLATADYYSGVSVLLGNGDGTFQDARLFPAGNTPKAVAVGEFNGDSHPDLAVVNQAFSESTVSVLLGNGDGTFQAPRSFATERESSSVAVGDVNHDGRFDLAVTNTRSNNVSVLLGNGDGTFQTARPFATGREPTSVAVGDVNADGRLDLAVANYYRYGTHDVSVLLGNGDGTFQDARSVPVGGRSPRSVVLSDFNGDDRLDLATANFYSNDGSVLLGNGDGTFRATRVYPVGFRPYFVAVGEFNGDGRPDLAVAFSGIGGDLAVGLGNGDGTFRGSQGFPAGVSTFGNVAVGDVNGDGRFDLTVPNESHNAVSVFVGNGDGTFQYTDRNFSVGSRPFSVAVGEFNGDGRLDLAVARFTDPFSNSVSVLLGNGDGTFQAARLFYAGTYTNSVAVGEFNGDGRLDLAVDNSGSGTVSVLLGNGDGTFQTARPSPAGSNPQSVTVGEFNGDGRLDLAVANLNNVSVLLGNGDGTFQPPQHLTTGRFLTVAVGEFSGDGRLDLAVAHYTDSNTVSVFLGNGDGTFQAARSFDVEGSAYSLQVGEFNGDGRLDLVMSNRRRNPGESYYASVLVGNGDGTFQAPRHTLFAPYFAGRGYVAVGDIDGDGRLDLTAAQPGGGGLIRVLPGNGDGTFQRSNVSYVGWPGLLSPVLADFDGDGFLDLTVANSGWYDVSVLLNLPVAFFFLYPFSGAVAAGAPFDLFVLALDTSINLVPRYTGEIAFWSSDPAATVPGPYRFQAADQGIASFPGGVTLRTPGTQYLVAFDTSTFRAVGVGVYEVTGAGPGGGSGRGPGQNALDGFATTTLEPLRSAAAFTGTPAIAQRPAPQADVVLSDRATLPVPSPRGTPVRAAVLPPALLDQLFAEWAGGATWERSPDSSLGVGAGLPCLREKGYADADC